MGIFTLINNRIPGKIRSILILSTLNLAPTFVFGQQTLHIATQSHEVARETQVTHGREEKKSEMNFAELANYFKAHPVRQKRQEPENEADDDAKPQRTQVADASLIHYRTATPAGSPRSAFSPVPPTLPISPTAADTFEASSDPGTLIPPDTHGAVDSNYAVTAINSVIRIQTRAGGAVSVLNLNSFWTSLISTGTFYDPRIHYDPSINRWICVTDWGPQATNSSLLIAVSKTSNPTGGWWMYKVLVDATGVNWLDYPNVGFNGKWLVVTGNLFTVSGNSYAGASTFVFNKANLASGTGASYTGFSNTSSFTIAPAITYDAAEQNLFMVESWWGQAPGGGQMKLWKIAGAVGSETMTSLGFPASAGFNWQGQSNAVSGTGGADFVPQLGTSSLIQANDDRVTQMIQMHNKLWFAHEVFLPYSTTANPTRVSVLWWQIDTLGTPSQIGLIDDPSSSNNKFYTFPTIAVNTSDDALVGFSVTSNQMHPSAGYALRIHTDPVDSMRPVFTYRHGQNTYFKNFGSSRDRWGDYSATCLDPLNQTDFWTIQEVSNTAVNTWDTWWAHIPTCATPPAITGTLTVCTGLTTSLTDATSGGTWTSSSANATVGSATGLVTGVTTGTAIISYAVTGGCFTSVIVTVNPSAVAGTISGPSAVCIGNNVTLTDAAAGGTWSSTSTANATVGTSGIVSGVAAGTTTISYTVTNSCGTAAATLVVSVSTAPSAGTVSGTGVLCAGANTTLTDATAGGSWSSGTPSVATVGSTGLVLGVTGGTATISYGVTNICTAYATTVVTVNPLPNAGTINGANSVCTGANITLTNAVSGGTWTSGAPSSATVGSTGIVTGVALGTATISYGVTNGCGTVYATAVISVNSLPAAGTITGTAQVCAGASVSLTDAVTGGTWSSGTTAVGTIGSTTGVATGITSGTAIITYAVSSGTGCSNTATAILTVNALPVVASITGTANVCIGGTVTLSDATGGGTWTSSSTSIATVGSTGIVTGVAAGTSTISYRVTNVSGCTGSATKVVTVNAVPTVTLGPSPSVGTGVVKGFLSFTVTGSPNAYNLAYSSAAHTAGFTDVTAGAVPSGLPFLITIPAAPAAATYTGTITVSTAAGCVSTPAPMSVTTSATGTWRTITSLAPHYNEGGMVLLTDGTVLVKTSNGGTLDLGTDWDRLTPVNGSYQNGTWSTIASMARERLYFSEQVMPDGRFYVCGGEYGPGGNYGEIYNPKTNTWVGAGKAGGSTEYTFPNVVSDANSEILFNGQVLQACVNESGVNWNYLYDPNADTYTRTANCLRVDNEAVWVKLPDSSVLFLDNYSTTSERFMPKTNTWINDGVCPVNLYDPYGFEAGAGYTLPDGRVFFIGSRPVTAYYTPSGTTAPGTWAAGPAIPLNLGAADAASAMLPNGKILMMLSPTPTAADHFPGPTYYYEFDYTTNTFTEVTAPGGGDTSSNSCYITNTLNLPDGCIMFVNQGYSRYYEYVPAGTPLAAGQPTISSITRTNCDTFSITGTLFNGITEGSAYGDDWQMSTNYPIVRLTSGSNVYYASTYKWNRIGAVLTGALPDTALFEIPATLPAGTYSVQVVVNGNPSANFTLNTSLAISPATASLCVGNTTTLTDAQTIGVWSSANSGTASVGTNGVVTGVAAGTTTISYKINQCFATATVTVNALPTATTGQTNVSCFGGTNGTATVTASGGSGSYSYAWSPSGGAASTASGLSAITYSCTVTDTRSCAITKVITITQPAVLAATAAQTNVNCFGGTTGTATVTASGGTTSYAYAWTPSGGTAPTASGLAAGIYTCTITDAHSCTYASVVSITQPSTAVTATTSQTNVSCNGGGNGTASVSAGGGTPSYTYAWSPSGGSASTAGGLSAGTYTCTITDANSCSTNKVVSITQPSTAVTATTSQSNVSCFGGGNGTASVSAGGGTPSYTYAWSPLGGSASTAGGLSAGTYTCTITDANSCPTNKVVSITQPSTAVTATTSQTNVSCNGGSNGTASVIASGGVGSYSYSWAPSGGSASSATGLSTGTYSCTVSDANGCSVVKTFTITEPAVLAISLGANPTVSYGTTSTAITYSVTSGTPVSYTITYDAAAHTAGFTDVTTTTLVPSSISLTIPAGAVTGTYNGSITVSNGSCTSSGNAFSISISGGGNIPPSFTGGSSQSLNICQDAGATNINSLLTVSDADAAQTETWTVVTGPANGSLSGFSTTASSGSASVTPTGLTYTPGTGYSGTDAFVVQVSDGSATATTTINVTIAAPAAAISGATSLCVGTGLSLSDAVTGGTWTSSAPTIISVSATGSVNALSAGTATISYTTGCGSAATLVVTALPTPGSINGPSSVCVGSSITLTDVVGGGVWTSGDPSTGTLDAVSGTFTGLAEGTNTISYTTGCGTPATKVITVIATPSAISGSNSLCAGTGISLSDAVSGGTWTSSAPTIISVSATGSVNALSAGTATISYATGCGSAATLTITALPAPASISGASSVCIGSSITLTDIVSGGVWSSSNPAAGTIDAVSGTLAGLGAGVTTISYSTTCGAPATYSVTVSAIADAGTITGSGAVCVTATTSLTDAAGGGVWSSGSPSIAAVSSVGTVTGVAAGTTTISYSVTTGCGVAVATYAVTVNTVSAGTISGPSSVNIGSNITLSDPVSGGTWSASNGNATVSGGLVTGVSVGTVTISYAVTNGCGTATATKVVTVNTSAVAGITGTTSVCIGLTTALTDATPGGTWSSSNAFVATVGTSGIVTGVAAGIATISYTVSGIPSTITVTVNANPSSIGGGTAVCVGSSISVSDFTAGGNWSSTANVSVAATGSTTGLVTGLAAGTSLITYALSTGCYKTYAINVNAAPAPISGTLLVCVGAVTFVSDATGGGVSWTSGTTSVATISASGGVTGISAGTTIITYTVASGCKATAVITVTAMPGAITGNAPLCQAASMTLTDAAGGGNWISSNTAVATVGSISGVVTGVSGGTATITYATGGSGCNVMTVVTINPLLSAGTITGIATVCTGATTTLSDITSGGVWSSGSTSVATVSSTGVVTGAGSGTATISYTRTNGCGSSSATLVVTVSPAGGGAGTITGTATLCAGATTSLTDAVTGGNWSSGSVSVATVGSDGTVTGMAAGTATISYSVAGGCGAAVATMVVTVSSVSAGTISGASTVYTGASITLTDAVGGGIWTASNGNATVSGGVVTGVTAGTVVISYAVTNGCGTATATKTVTVNAGVTPITGSGLVCIGTTTSLTDATAGGVWSSSNTFIATVATSGIVTGVAVGAATISYTVAGIPATMVVTVSTNPSSIGGATSVCVGSSISVSDFTPGGTWSSTSNASIASTGSTTALVTGLTAGTATITYSLGTGCFKTYAITVKANPAPISGTLAACVGGKTFVSDATTPGVSWTSGTTSVATITASGVVTGISTGTTIITYTISTGCIATAIVTVNPLPVVAPITGASTVSHAGPPITLLDATAGGVWSSSAPAVATVGSATGVVTAIASAGNTTISYTVTALGCVAASTKTVTATAAPRDHGGSSTTSGTTIVNAGETVSIADEAVGDWSSSDNTVATVSMNGAVTGVAAGFANITRSVTNSNGETITTITPVIVNPHASTISILPNPNNGTFTIKGKLANVQREDVSLKITDMLGQVIYENVVKIQDGAINEQVKLNSNLANGMYMLNVKSGNDNMTFHFVIEN